MYTVYIHIYVYIYVYIHACTHMSINTYSVYIHVYSDTTILHTALHQRFLSPGKAASHRKWRGYERSVIRRWRTRIHQEPAPKSWGNSSSSVDLNGEIRIKLTENPSFV